MAEPGMSPEAVAERRDEYLRAVYGALYKTLLCVWSHIRGGTARPVERDGYKGVNISMSPDSSITAFFDPDASEERVIDSLFVSMGDDYCFMAKRQNECLEVILYDECIGWERHLE